ncbi:MAG: 3-phosphoserine/phosphohydroxythreonine transaminase [Candidatus Hydrogenedentota bacterium]
MSDKTIYNFCAGPATLPKPAIKQAQEELLSYKGTGMSVMEISHRSKWADEIIAEAEGNIRSLLQVPENYHILFLQGGASLQFSMIPMNFLRGTGKSADYIHTGSWANKAIAEAQKEGTVSVPWNGKDENFVRTPAQSELKLDANAAYVHFTSNETIQGVEYFGEPETGNVPLMCDASSDFLSRPIPVEKYGLLYAGAQKNIGPAGVTAVIIRDDLLERVPEGLPSLLDYKNMADSKSLYNTPPMFAIYMVMLTTRWVRNDIGGLRAMEAINRKKADILYEAIDNSNGFYKGHANPECRSRMNVTWRLPSEDLEKQFISEAEQQGFLQLKGHRSVGGLRASIYNAMPVEGCEALRDFMEAFRKKNT